MNELERLEAWLNERITEYEAQAEKFRRADFWHTLTVCYLKRNEAILIMEHVRLMIEAGMDNKKA